MYTRHFNFSEIPFSISPDPKFLYMSPRHQEGLAHLLYGIKRGGGFVVLTGEVGTGKTTLCYCLLDQLPEDIDIALIFNPKLNSIELLASICDELGISYQANGQSLKKYVDLLNNYLLDAHAKGRRTVLMIDEAQNLSFDVLEQIRLLTNLETSKTKLLQIVLIGQPELQQLLNRKELRQLNQRITARYHLEALSFKDTRSYIRHRLSVSGASRDIFRDSALRRIHKLSRGIPRLINILCDRALLGAYSGGKKIVTKKIINQAAREAMPPVNYYGKQIQLAAVAAILLVCGYGIFHYFRGQSLVVEPEAAVVQPLPKVVERTEVLPALPENSETEVIIKPEPEPEPEPEIQDFSEFLSHPGLSMDSAFLLALDGWGVKLTAGQKPNCETAQEHGLLCLFDRTQWNTLIGFDRPAILEFSLPGGNKRFALLVGTDQGNPILRFKKNLTFKLEDVLSYWDGYYLVLWRPPTPGISGIFFQQSSDSVLWLRQLLDPEEENSTPRIFDEDLKQKVQVFQRQRQLLADGAVGPRTMIHLQNMSELDHSPRLESGQ